MTLHYLCIIYDYLIFVSLIIMGELVGNWYKDDERGVLYGWVLFEPREPASGMGLF